MRAWLLRLRKRWAAGRRRRWVKRERVIFLRASYREPDWRDWSNRF